jgi:hypothetical protein
VWSPGSSGSSTPHNASLTALPRDDKVLVSCSNDS